MKKNEVSFLLRFGLITKTIEFSTLDPNFMACGIIHDFDKLFNGMMDDYPGPG